MVNSLSTQHTQTPSSQVLPLIFLLNLQSSVTCLSPQTERKMRKTERDQWTRDGQGERWQTLVGETGQSSAPPD